MNLFFFHSVYVIVHIYVIWGVLYRMFGSLVQAGHVKTLNSLKVEAFAEYCLSLFHRNALQDLQKAVLLKKRVMRKGSNEVTL